MKKHIVVCIPFGLEISAFFVSNRAIQLTLALLGLYAAFVVFKKNRPEAYLDTKETLHQVFALYKWKNFKSLVFDNPDGIISGLLWLGLLICLLLCFILCIHYLLTSIRASLL